MAGYRSYPQYKDSGVEWLGKVPKHWKVKRIKNLATYNDEALDEGTDPDFEIEYVDISSVNLVDGITSTEMTSFEKAPSRARRKVKDGDTIVSTVRTYLKAIAAINNPPENLIVSTGFAVIRPKPEIDSDYLGYLLQSEGFVGDVVANSVGVSYPAINASVLAALPAVQPGIEEQQIIARFLDYKTAQIDALISKKEMLLGKLAEKRTALISHAVTKGFNPNAKLKDSGVEWLGQVPVHWVVKRLKFSVSLVNEKAEAQEADFEYMGLEHIESWSGRRIDDENANSDGIAAHFLPNDILFGKLRPYLAKVYLAKHEGLVSTEALVIRPSGWVHPTYLRYYMASQEFIRTVDSSTYGSKMPRASWDFIGNLPMLLPDYQEQKSIALSLDNEIARLDLQVGKVNSVIEKLGEYRSALITQAVTGKIDVRNCKISEA